MTGVLFGIWLGIEAILSLDAFKMQNMLFFSCLYARNKRSYAHPNCIEINSVAGLVFVINIAHCPIMEEDPLCLHQPVYSALIYVLCEIWMFHNLVSYVAFM